MPINLSFMKQSLSYLTSVMPIIGKPHLYWLSTAAHLLPGTKINEKEWTFQMLCCSQWVLLTWPIWRNCCKLVQNFLAGKKKIMSCGKSTTLLHSLWRELLREQHHLPLTEQCILNLFYLQKYCFIKLFTHDLSTLSDGVFTLEHFYNVM